MATVTVVTAAKSQEIEDASVVDGSINGSGHLILTTHGGTDIDAGLVAGGSPDASATVKGIVELATDAETATGTDTVRAVTPAGLASVLDDKQNADDDLTSISAMTPSNDDVIQRKSGSWTHRSMAQLASDLPLPSKAETARNDLGIYVPPGWGAFWKAKRNAAGSGQAVIAGVGSSSTQGLYSSNLLTAPFMSKLMTSLQTSYGDGGSGYFSSARSLKWFGASTTSNAWAALSGNFASVTGADWDIGNPYGPSGVYLYTQTVGNSATFIVRGTKAKIYTVSGAGRSNWSYTVDGGSSTNVTDSGTGGTTIQVTTISGLSSGNHTIVCTKAGSAGTTFGICGIEGSNNTGIIVNNFGISGAGSQYFAGTGFSDAYGIGRWSGGPDYPADLIIYAAGSNNATVGMDGDSWAAHLRTYLQGVKDGATVGGTNATGTTDVLILMQHIGKYDATHTKWQDYVARARPIAEAYNAALVNMWTLGRNSWNYWNSLSYWGNSAATGGVSGTDSIHMSDAGHTATANAILPILTAA